MHELSIALRLIEIAEEEATERGNVRVAAIHLRLGELSGIVKDALLSAFEIARQGTALADAQLVVEEVPISVFCSKCGCESMAVAPQYLRCVKCGTPTADVVRGRELEVTALEIEL